MATLTVQGVAFDMYGTVVDVGAVAEACKAVASDPVAFNNQWRAKQLEYTFLRSAMGKYQDFWKVSQQALAFTIQRFGLTVNPEQRKRPWSEELWIQGLLDQPGRSSTRSPRARARHRREKL